MRGRSRKKKIQYEKRGKPQKKTSQKILLGRVDKNPKGFAFLICKDRKIPDAFVSRADAHDLLDGDLVEYVVRKEGRRNFADVKRIIERGQTRVLVFLKRQGNDFYGTTAEGENYGVKAARGLNPDQFAIGLITDYPAERKRGRIEVLQTLGPHLLPKHDYLIAAAKFNLREAFPPEVLQELETRRTPVAEILKRETDRKDHRKLPFVTIDGEDAKDFDDAVLVEKSASGPAYRLYVAIADVSHYVIPRSPVDQEALARGTSVYFPGTCIPMLPEALSNDLCSLRPREDKLTLTAEMHFDAYGTVVGQKFYKSAICTTARLTYTSLQQFYDEGRAEGIDPKVLSEPLGAAHELFKLLLKKRSERGVMDFELPESKIIIDPDGKPIEAKRSQRFDSHRLIEEFMIAANRAVAQVLRESAEPALYRVHESPDPQSLEDINLLLQSLGLSQSLDEISPREFARILSSTAKLKGSHTLHQAILRMQRQARYEPEPKGHFGLALEDYCHFTSPIRRYPDLVVHRALKKMLSRAGKKSDKNNEPLDAFVQLGLETSERERRAMVAERFAVKRKQCWFMRQRLGEVYPAVVCGVTANGLFLEVVEFGIEGFLPVESIRGVYEFDESRQCLIRRSSKEIISLGDSLTIQVARVSITDNEITFAQY